MHAVQILQENLLKSCPGIHKKRIPGIVALSGSLMRSQSISITNLGRNIQNNTSEKHSIKRADNLLGSSLLYRNQISMYAMTAAYVIPKSSRPHILVDWTPMPNQNFYALVAAVPKEGSSINIYTEVHPASQYNNHKIHATFIKNLKNVLPTPCKPILVTDAGFKAPWFNEVVHCGWDYIGRVRGTAHIQLELDEEWMKLENLYKNATSVPTTLGRGLLNKTARRSQIETTFTLYKGKKKGRKKITKNKTICKSSHSIKHEKQSNNPWLLVSSLNDQELPPEKVVSIYKKRMQIEEMFRAIKSTRFGYSLNHARTNNSITWANLIMIAALSLFLVYVIGSLAEKQNMHKQFQANTVFNERVLSLIYLGTRILIKCPDKIPKNLIENELAILKYQCEAFV